MKALKIAGAIIALALLSWGALHLGLQSIKDGERVECNKLERQSREYAGQWYSTDWQRDMCKEYGIFLPETTGRQ